MTWYHLLRTRCARKYVLDIQTTTLLGLNVVGVCTAAQALVNLMSSRLFKTELIEQVLERKIAEDFHIVALQAVMADLLGEDTIHHALNLPVYGKHELFRITEATSNGKAVVAVALAHHR